MVGFSLPAGSVEEDLAQLRALPGVSEVRRTRDHVSVHGDRAVIAHTGAWIVRRGPVPVDLRVETPDLEAALLSLLDDTRDPIGAHS